MGLISAALGAATGVLADQWKEYFYCEALPNNVLAVKGRKRVSGRSSNRGSDNIISSGSVIAVADGQCMLIVEQGKIVDVCAEPGEYIYDSSTEPSIFSGKLGEGILEVFKQIGKRFTFGGGTANDQRGYFFNTKEIMGNKYGTPTPVPFRVVDANIGLDIDISVRCNGEFSYRIADPLLFYKNVCGNAADSFTRDKIDSQLRSELLTALQPAFARISEMGIRYSSVPGHTMELTEALNQILSASWSEKRGIVIVAMGMNSIATSPEDEERIKELQRMAVYRDPNMRAALSADAMKTAAGNEAGAMVGFMGMNMAQQSMGNMAAQGFYGDGTPYQAQNAYQVQQPQRAAAANGWACPKCGAQNTGKFCMECGTPQPAPAGTWACPKCGTQNKGKFCMECGTPQPSAGPAEWTCPKCGAKNTGKFCFECGTPQQA